MIHTSLSGEGSRSLSNSSSDLFGLLWAAIGVYYTKNCKLQLLLGSSDLIDSHLRNLGEITGLEILIGSTCELYHAVLLSAPARFFSIAFLCSFSS